MTGAYAVDPAEPLGSDVPDDPAGSPEPVEPESAVSVPPDPGWPDDAEPSVGRVGEPEGLDVADVCSVPLPVSDDADALSPGRGVFCGSSSAVTGSVPGTVFPIAWGDSGAGVSPPYGPAPNVAGSGTFTVSGPPSICVFAGATWPGAICSTSGVCQTAPGSCAMLGGPTRPDTWLCAAVATGSLDGSPGTGPPSGPASVVTAVVPLVASVVPASVGVAEVSSPDDADVVGAADVEPARFRDRHAPHRR